MVSLSNSETQVREEKVICSSVTHFFMPGQRGGRVTVNFPPLPTPLSDTNSRALTVSWNAGSAQISKGIGCRILYYRTEKEERGRERERERSGTVLSDTNFSSRDICSTCSSHLSFSRCYIPGPRSLEQAAKDSQRMLSASLKCSKSILCLSRGLESLRAWGIPSETHRLLVCRVKRGLD